MVDAGWYDDPAGSGYRYWDGDTWTDRHRPAAHERSRSGTGIAAAVVGLVAGVVMGGVATLVCLAITTDIDQLTTTGAAEITTLPPTVFVTILMASSIGLWAGFCGAAWWTSARHRTGRFLTDMGLTAPTRGDVAIGLGVAVVARVVTIGISLAAEAAVGPFDEGAAQIPSGLVGNLGPVGLGLLALTVAVGAPVFEELFFRGHIQRSLLERLRPAAAITITAAVFSLIHANPAYPTESAVTVAGIFPVAVALGYLAHRRGNITAAIVTHIAFNGSGILLLAATGG